MSSAAPASASASAPSAPTCPSAPRALAYPGADRALHLHMRSLTKAVRQNYALLFAALALTVIALAVVVYLLYKMVEAVRVHYVYVSRRERAKFVDNEEDLYKYDDEEQDSAEDDDPHANEYARIQNKIRELERKYADYNAELAKYSRQVLGKPPTNLVDRNVMDRTQDEYPEATDG